MRIKAIDASDDFSDYEPDELITAKLTAHDDSEVDLDDAERRLRARLTEEQRERRTRHQAAVAAAARAGLNDALERAFNPQALKVIQDNAAVANIMKPHAQKILDNNAAILALKANATSALRPLVEQNTAAVNDMLKSAGVGQSDILSDVAKRKMLASRRNEEPDSLVHIPEPPEIEAHEPPEIESEGALDAGYAVEAIGGAFKEAIESDQDFRRGMENERRAREAIAAKKAACRDWISIVLVGITLIATVVGILCG